MTEFVGTQYPDDLSGQRPTGGMEGEARTLAQSVPSAESGCITEGEITTAGRMLERGDVLADLRKRARNAETVAKAHPDGSDEWVAARQIARFCDVLIGDFSGGLHEGSADVEEMLAGSAA